MAHVYLIAQFFWLFALPDEGGGRAAAGNGTGETDSVLTVATTAVTAVAVAAAATALVVVVAAAELAALAAAAVAAECAIWSLVNTGDQTPSTTAKKSTNTISRVPNWFVLFEFGLVKNVKSSL